MVDKSFECENASENAAARFVQPGWLIELEPKILRYDIYEASYDKPLILLCQNNPKNPREIFVA